MKVLYDKAVIKNPLDVLRKAGYAGFTDPNTGIFSFELRTSAASYPRFHVYVEEKGGNVSVSLHLDQKKPSYGTNHAHSGEYEGAIIEKEMRRIDGWVTEMKILPLTKGELEGVAPTEASSSRPWWKVW